ncbi:MULTISPECIES: efflux RND transporter periplasmic adaptor subunit [Cupriavidus]|uniref:efflux RND transporter periplasmic adaptor subunit n=1 Tax=Cupriavidus neocaledonicus TaxID=1040979 RepID=UPI0023F6C875|nr:MULTISPECIES: efflux RND transporter periplasmic adaptor subunit [Cupriavidus]
MQTEKDLTIETLLAEDGDDARLRLWGTRKDKAIAAKDLAATGTLKRPTGETEALAFVAKDGYLESTTAIGEPHVFQADIVVRAAGAQLTVALNKDEDVVRLSESQLKSSNVAIQAAGPAQIASTLQFPGEIRFNEDRTAHVVPRLAGVAEAVPASLGQTVKKGEVLAVIASTQLSEQRSELLAAQQRLALAKTTYQREKKLWEERISAEQDYLQARTALQEAEIAVRNAGQKLSAIGASAASKGLNRFELRAPFDGVIVEKHLALGEAVKEDANVFTISDLSTVWAEFVISPKDLGNVRVGEQVTISSTAFEEKAQGKVSYVGALLGEQTRTARARVTLNNPKMGWRPGLFVTVSLTAGVAEAPVTVTTEAIQTVRDEPVVFVAVPGGFLPQPVKLGHSDGKRTEIREGMRAGMKYAATNSFLLKAELGKAGAEHAH